MTEDAAAELPQADVVALALHPQGIVDFLARYRDAFKPGALVWDVCGVKTAILEAAQVLPGTVDFIGCHPMAGTEFSGVEHAFAEMFRDSHFLLVPRDDSRPEHIALLERLAPQGCLSLHCYTGHEGGAAEEAALAQRLARLEPRRWRVLHCRDANRETHGESILLAERLPVRQR